MDHILISGSPRLGVLLKHIVCIPHPLNPSSPPGYTPESLMHQINPEIRPPLYNGHFAESMHLIKLTPEIRPPLYKGHFTESMHSN